MELGVRDLSFSYGAGPVLKGVTATFPPHQLTVILGPSGCGKTTLLRCLVGLERPNRGDIVVDGRVLTAAISNDHSVSMVFQDLALYQSLTVQENITLALRSRREKQQAIDRRLNEIASTLHITTLLSERVNEVSGGERQRVALARSLILNPSLLLLDEPFSNLDGNVKSQLRLTLKLLLRARATTVIMVTHDQDDAFELADKMIVMNDGTIEQVGNSVEIYNHPSNLFIASFIGNPKINVINCEAIPELSEWFPNVETVAIRPENVLIGDGWCTHDGVKIEGALLTMFPRPPLFNKVFDTPVGTLNVVGKESALRIGDKASLVLPRESFVILRS